MDIPDYSDTAVRSLEYRVSVPSLGIDNIYDRVLKVAQSKIRSEADLERFLRAWWCLRYNRPYRDPLLSEYSLEELIVEYLDVSYRSNPESFKKIKAEEAAKQEDEEWITKMAEEFGEKLLSPEEQAKHEEEIEESLGKHAEEHEVEDLLTMGTHHKFDVQE